MAGFFLFFFQFCHQVISQAATTTAAKVSASISSEERGIQFFILLASDVISLSMPKQD